MGGNFSKHLTFLYFGPDVAYFLNDAFPFFLPFVNNAEWSRRLMKSF